MKLCYSAYTDILNFIHRLKSSNHLIHQSIKGRCTPSATETASLAHLNRLRFCIPTGQSLNFHGTILGSCPAQGLTLEAVKVLR